MTDAELGEGLVRLGRHFDLAALLSERRGREAIVPYFTRSALLYALAHSLDGAMHMALNPEGRFDPRGYAAQATFVDEHVRAVGARNVLEIGCGRGFNLLRLSHRNAETAFVGVDLTPWHVRAARVVARRRRNVDLVVADFHQLPFADESFDLVFSVEAICHADDVYRVVGEVHRVLRPGGRFVVIEPWRSPGFDTFGEAAQTAVRVIEKVFVLPDLQEFDVWLDRTTALGFEPVHVEDVTEAALPNLEKLRRQAARWRHASWRRRSFRRLAPRLVENAVAALVLGECFRDGAATAPGCYRIAVLDRAPAGA
jgi:arsenite methyltransferase